MSPDEGGEGRRARGKRLKGFCEVVKVRGEERKRGKEGEGQPT